MTSTKLIFPFRVLATEDPVGSWSTEPSLPYSLASHEVVDYNDTLFLLGGAGTISHSEILAATISPDGLLSSWEVVANLPQPIFWASVVVNENRIYHMGGAVYPPTHSIDSVYTATINPDGTFSGWTTLIPLPQRLSTGKAFIYNNRIYYIGGATNTFGSGPVLQSGVYSAQINEDGTIGPWQTLTPLPQARYELTAFLSNNKLIVMGGATTGTKATNSVIAATINPLDGTIGNWESLPSLPEPSRRPGHILTGGYFILLGGYNGSEFLDSIYYAPVNPDGTPGTWTKSSNTLPTINCCFPLVEHNGFLYMTGGHDLATYLVDVRRARFTGAVEPEADSVILLPGLGASWNRDALICNAEVGWEDWEMTPGIHHYDGIIQTFQEALGEDFHVFFYDWTKPVDQIADDLKTFIDEVVNPPPETNVDLIGHSLGGLVARAYLQKYSDSNGVDQIITLGSPHLGAPQAYYAWEGANFSELVSPVEAILATLLTFSHRGLTETLVDVVQEEIPSLKDLLAIFNYLIDHRTGDEIPLGSMTQQNEWLLGNLIPPELSSYFHAFLGLSGNTPRWLRVLPRSRVDELRGRWEDGRPIKEEYDAGDETVLAKSATISGAPKTEFTGINHSGLVTSVEAQEALLGELGILDVSPTPGSDSIENGVFMAALLPLTCPADSLSTLSIRLTDPLGRAVGQGAPVNIPEAIYHPQDQMIIVPGAVRGNYRVEVLGEPGDEYRLIIGGIGEIGDVWSDSQGKIGKNGVSVHQMRFTQEQEEFKLNLVQLAKSRLEELDAWLASSAKPFRPAHSQIREVISYLQLAEKQLQQGNSANASQGLWAAFNRLENLQNNTTNWQKSGKISQETADTILFETTQARDYLLQTLEILGE